MEPTLNQSIIQLADLVSRTSIMQRFRFIQTHNLSHSQMISLFYLAYHKEVSVNELAKHLGITNVGVSQLVERLVRIGLVNRVDNPHDRRGKLLELSEKGLDLVKQARSIHHQWVTQMVEGLNPEDAEIIQQSVEIVLKKVSESELNHPEFRPGETI